jgi:uncharacterized protein (TIGR02145 family)
MKKILYLFVVIIAYSCSTSTDENGNSNTTVVPLPPTGLTGTVASSTQINLSWTDNSTNETGFKIERRTGSANYSVVGTVNQDILSFSDTGLTPNTTYKYRVYAYNAVGNSLTYTNEVTLTTPTQGGLSNLTTTAASSITQTTATTGGIVSSDGGATITTRGVVWSTSANPTISLTTKTTDGTGIGAFTSNITGLSANTTYYVRAYGTNNIGTAYGNEVSFTTVAATVLPNLTTTAASSITQTTAVSGGTISSDGGGAITARGVCWSTMANPTIALTTKTIDGTGTGAFTSNITALTANATYYVRAYATNSQGTAYGNEVNFITITPNNTPSYPAGSVFCASGPTAIVNVTNPVTGKIWMDRNLGATQAATYSTDANSYGDLYQWGRRSDGHQCRTSATTTILSSVDQPANGNFIRKSNSPFDWRSPHNNNLWQGVNGVNNPCPSGYRLPTATELIAESTSWSQNNSAGAFASPLKLPMAGGRACGNGLLFNVGASGDYWSSSVSNSDSGDLGFTSSYVIMYTSIRANGYSVRCLKD